MTDHLKLAKHGKRIDVVSDNPKIAELLERIYNLQYDASFTMGIVILQHKDKSIVRVGCTQCLLDAALQFHDLSEALKELVEL